jgi:imidazolonepropionase-like amidohydrolase
MTARLIALAAAGLVLLASHAIAEPVVIEADGYVDVVAGKLVRPAVIVVDGERIAAVNPAVPPAGAKRLSLPGQVLLPGLMDAHTHLNYIIGEGWETEPVRFTGADFAMRGIPFAAKTLLAGFTTVRDLGTGLGFSDVALMRAIDRGWVIGPRMIPAGHALSITGGHCDQTTGLGPGVVPPEFVSGTADGVDEVLKAVRYQVKHGAKVIKICATAGVLSFEGPAGAQQYSLEELRAAADEAHRHGLRIAAHAHGTEGIIAASDAGIDSIEHNSMMTDEAACDHQEERQLRNAHAVPDRCARPGVAAAAARGEAAQARAAGAGELQARAQERPQDCLRHRRGRLPARRQREGVRRARQARRGRRCTRSRARRS